MWVNDEHLLREIRHDVRRILAHLDLIPRLARVQLAFMKENFMNEPTVGPVLLTLAGQAATASIVGFDQFGNPWNGAIPPVSFSIDTPAIATSTPNADGVTDVVTAVSNGVANLTAMLTTAENVALTDTETVTVAIPPPPPPPTPVLSSIKIAFTPIAAAATA